MSEPNQTRVGAVIWVDLTVPNTEEVRDFYQEVIGWAWQPVSQGDYDDYNMLPPGTDQPAAGVIQKRGVNADIPSQWMIYVTVADLDASLAAVERRGGQRVTAIKDHDGHRMCVIQDPAGAVLTLYQAPAE